MSDEAALPAIIPEVDDVAAKQVAEIINLDDPAAPLVLIAHAHNPAHPLHRYFEWDNDAAAHGYRLLQAGLLIQRTRIRVLESPTEIVHVQVESGPNSSGAAQTHHSHHPDIAWRNAMAEIGVLRSRWQAKINFDELLRQELSRSKTGPIETSEAAQVAGMVFRCEQPNCSREEVDIHRLANHVLSLHGRKIRNSERTPKHANPK